MGRSRYQFIPGHEGPYFITCTVINWIVLFNKPKTADILLNSFRFLIENNRLIIHGWVIMEHHIHAIASSPDVSKEIGDFKSFTARKIIDQLEKDKQAFILRQLKFYKKQHKENQKYQLWQEGSHPELLTSREALNTRLDYMHDNPVRSGYVDEPEHWRYSSCRDYQGKIGLLPVQIIGL